MIVISVNNGVIKRYELGKGMLSCTSFEVYKALLPLLGTTKGRRR